MSISRAWPTTLTRDQRTTVKRRDLDFFAALRRDARKAGWHFARRTLFRQHDDWFISILPSLLWERGAVVRLEVKPMALDPLFWDIVGLKDNEALPLSFGTTGAWVLRPPFTEEPIGSDVSEVGPLATAVLTWANDQAIKKLERTSVESTLAQLSTNNRLCGSYRAVATCLHILSGNLDAATDLCSASNSDSQWLRESGGFISRENDGTTTTFLDQAREWIVRKRHSEARTAQSADLGHGRI